MHKKNAPDLIFFFGNLLSVKHCEGQYIIKIAFKEDKDIGESKEEA